MGRIIEAILPSYVIFYLAALDFEHKVEGNAPPFLRERRTNGENRELDF